jgi:cytochrome c
MSMRKLSLAAALALATSVPVAAQVQTHYGFGTPATPQELSRYFSIPADGRGLPPGSGTATKGAKLFAEQCAACHGDRLQGNPAAGLGGDRLIGGRGTLASNAPVKTVGSYWPYATTLFDYIKRAMPFTSPGSLSDDDVYSLVAFILAEADVIMPNETMDARSLPKVTMPNRNGFEPDPRPELELYR